MNESKSLRVADRRLGRLLCALVSLPLALGRFFRGRRTGPTPTREILVVELFEMGASIMIAPSLSLIRRLHPDARITVLTTTTCRASWRALGLVDDADVFAVDGGGAVRFVLSLLGQLLRLRQRAVFDVAIDFDLFYRISALSVGLVRARRRAGFHAYAMEGLSRGRVFDVRCAFNQNTHIARNFLALTRAALAGATDLPALKDHVPLEDLTLPRWHPTERIRVETEALLEGIGAKSPRASLTVVCPDVGKTLNVRNYSAASYAYVISRLLAQDEHRVVALVGTAGDKVTSETIVTLVKSPRCVDLCGRTSFDQLLGLVDAADLVLCNDNGIAHFAALTRTPTVALFSTDSPFVYGPLGPCLILYSYFHCSPCIMAFNHKNSGCKESRCLQALSPHTVWQYAERALVGDVQFQTVNDTTPYVFGALPDPGRFRKAGPPAQVRRYAQKGRGHTQTPAWAPDLARFADRVEEQR